MNEPPPEGEPSELPREELERRLEEAEATVRAVVTGKIDAILNVSGIDALLLQEAQKALHASEELHRLILEHITDAVFLTDREGRFTYISPSAPLVFGYTLEEVAALGNISALLGSNLLKDRSLEMSEEIFHSEVQVKVRGETFRDLHVTFRQVKIPGSHYLYACRDQTENKSLQGQLLHAQKMEAIGQLTAGIAHDFNNLMTVVVGYGDLMLNALPPDSPHRSGIENMTQAGMRATALTRKLLAFGRKQVLQPKVIRLNALVEGMQEILPRLLGEYIEIRTNMDPDAGAVEVDYNQMEQVLMNLAVNARDAMPKGGILILRTTNKIVDQAFVGKHLDAAPGAYVLLEVSDTGSGMEKAILDRIFEPFFTTKPFGAGTGLGLSTSLGIVKQSGGILTAYSEPGLGSTFKIYLPRADQSEALEPESNSPSDLDCYRGEETVLVVEDEQEVLALTKLVLEEHGYRTLAVSTAPQALETVSQRADKIDLLLTDMVLVNCNGRELSEKIRERQPSLKVIFMSGYTDDVLIHHGTLPPRTAFIEKPFTPDELLKKVRETLDSK